MEAEDEVDLPSEYREYWNRYRKNADSIADAGAMHDYALSKVSGIEKKKAALQEENGWDSDDLIDLHLRWRSWARKALVLGEMIEEAMIEGWPPPRWEEIDQEARKHAMLSNGTPRQIAEGIVRVCSKDDAPDGKSDVLDLVDRMRPSATEGGGASRGYLSKYPDNFSTPPPESRDVDDLEEWAKGELSKRKLEKLSETM